MAQERAPEKWLAPEMATTEGQRNPYPWYEKMREKGPIRHDPDRNAFDVFHYDEVNEIGSDWERFTRLNTSYIDGAMLDRGPPEHTELRGMAEVSFRPGNIREYRSELERRADDLLDAALNGERTFDFVEELAKPMPILVIADLLGVPTENMDTFREWSATLAESPAKLDEEAKRETMERKGEAKQAVLEFFRREIEKREEQPRDDLITTMVRAEKASDLLTRDHTVANCAMLLVAGNITTTNYMTNALWTFIEENVVDDLQDGSIDIVEANKEVLRYRSPVIGLKRYATEDTEVAGTEIPEGSLVIGYIPSANRDAQVFDDPDEFKPGRKTPKEPIPFGTGIHYCLGAPLANLEAEIMLSKFLDRIEDVEMVDDEIEPFFSSEIYGPVELPIRVST